MSKIRLFNIKDGTVEEKAGHSVRLEKDLQNLMEKNLEELLGVKFLATEYSTGAVHKGRIDTLGIDENNCPVIIEYKRHTSESVINQGFYYLNWLLDHKAEYENLVRDVLGQEVSQSVEWTEPRIICIAGGFNKFDIHTADHLTSNSNIDLITYIKYEDQLLLEQVHSTEVKVTSKLTEESTKEKQGSENNSAYRDVMYYLNRSSETIKNLYQDMDSFILSLGDDVSKKVLKKYVAYRRFGNFITLIFQPREDRITLHMDIDPKSIELKGNMEDISQKEHSKIGDLKIFIHNKEEFKNVMPLLERAYLGE